MARVGCSCILGRDSNAAFFQSLVSNNDGYYYRCFKQFAIENLIEKDSELQKSRKFSADRSPRGNCLSLFGIRKATTGYLMERSDTKIPTRRYYYCDTLTNIVLCITKHV